MVEDKYTFDWLGWGNRPDARDSTSYISQLDTIGRGRFDITLAERGVFVQGKLVCLGRTVTKKHLLYPYPYPLHFLRRCEIPWAVISLVLSSQTRRLHDETWWDLTFIRMCSTCCFYQSKNPIANLELLRKCTGDLGSQKYDKRLESQQFLWLFEGGFRSLNFSQVQTIFTQPKGGTCPGVPNHCGKAAAWSLDPFTQLTVITPEGGVQGSKGLKVAYNVPVWFCQGMTSRGSLFWVDMEFWMFFFFGCRICWWAVFLFCWGTIAWFWMPMARRHRVNIPTCKVIIT